VRELLPEQVQVRLPVQRVRELLLEQVRLLSVTE
jgi:hypothetical protein